MGFVKDLLTRCFGTTVDKMVDSVVDNVTDGIKQYTGKASAPALTLNERIEKVVRERYPEYELKKDVDASIFSADAKAWNYSYTLSKNGNVGLTIMVLQGKNDYRRKAVTLAHEASEKAGVHCINIMEYLPSKEDYIIKAISENIR